jgi:hypothetical protein
MQKPALLVTSLFQPPSSTDAADAPLWRQAPAASRTVVVAESKTPFIAQKLQSVSSTFLVPFVLNQALATCSCEPTWLKSTSGGEVCSVLGSERDPLTRCACVLYCSRSIAA